jgi:hypothetical protein
VSGGGGGAVAVDCGGCGNEAGVLL